MGVTLLQSLNVPPDKTAPQVVEIIQRRISHLGAVKTGQFLVDCETYTSTSSLQSSLPGAAGKFGKTFHVLHNSEHPATVFTVLEPPPQPAPPPPPPPPAGAAAPPPQPPVQPPNKRLTFTSDTLFDLLLLKLEKFYQKKLKIESKGARYELRDFVVKLGIVTAASSVKGILIEVEYLPCVGINACWDLINEFAQSFIGSEVSGQLKPYLKDKTPNEVYTPADTIHQYLEHFITFRKTGLLGGSSQQQQGATPQR